MLPYINIPFLYLSRITGASPDELKLITSFCLSYPFAAILKRIPDRSPWRKNVFIISVSLFYLLGLYTLWSGVFVLLACAVGTYIICSTIKGPYMPWVGFVFLMGYMSISHIYRMTVNDDGIVDVSGAQMVLVMKLTAFCFNVFDGTQKVETLDEYQKDRRVVDLPGMLDYLGFVFFFPSLMAGPAFDYMEYKRWIETSMFDLPPGTDPKKAPATRKQRRIPRSGWPAAFKAVTGLLWILMFLNFSRFYNAGVVLGETYKGYGILRRIWVLYMLGFTSRMKYYGVWTLTEGACILSGIGFKGLDPVTGKADWSRLVNVRPLQVESAQNSHEYLASWNINTNNWLKNYIYLRVTPRGKKPGFRATMATFVTSAFWHGFYPGYYLTFILGSFLQNTAKNSRRLLRPFFMSQDGKTPLPRKIYYDLFSFLVTQLAFTFTVAPFILLDIRDSLLVWHRVYYYCIIAIAVSSLLMLTPVKPWLQKQVRDYTTTKQEIHAKPSHDNLDTYLGLPNDPGQEWDEMMDEVSAEIDRRRAEGKPITKELREKLGHKTLSDSTTRIKKEL